METYKGIRTKGRTKKWEKGLKFKKQKLKTAIDSKGVNNNTKNDQVFSYYKVDNATGVEAVDNQSEREHSVDGKIQRKKSYADILKTDRNTTGKLEKNRNEGAADIMANESCLQIDLQSMKPML